MTTITITAERPDTRDAARLVAELDAELEPLYERFGFVPIDAFGGYKPDPVSLFYELRLPTASR